MKTLFMPIVVVLFLALSAFAAEAALTNLVASSPAYPAGQTGANPGDTVTFTFTLSNTDTSAVIASMSSTPPTAAQSTIAAPTIAAVNLPASGSGSGSFSIVVPSTAASTYTAILTAQVNATINITTAYSFIVNSVTKWELVGSSVEYTGKEGAVPKPDNGGQKISVKNTGSSAITPTTVSEIKLNDTEGKQVTITIGSLSSVLPGQTKDLPLTFSKIQEGMAIGTYTASANVVVGSETKPISFTLNVNPELCEKGPQGNLFNVEIKDPDRNDDFKPGEVMNIKVSVKNNANNDKDVVVEAFLWNVDENSEIASAESDSINIDKGKKEDFEFTLTMPTSESDLGETDDLILYIQAFEDGEEDKQCVEKSLDLNGERDSKDARVTRFAVNPAVAQCGKLIGMQVDVENLGKREDKIVTVSVKNPELELDLTSESFALDAFDESDNVASKVFTFAIPEDAAEKEYILEAFTTFDGGKKKDSEFAKLTVSRCGEITPTGGEGPFIPTKTDFSLVQQTLNTNPGVIGIPFKITNAEKQSKTFTVEVQPAGTWTTTSSTAVVVQSGESKSDFLYVVTDKGLQDGSYQGSLVLKADGSTLDSEQFTVNIGVTPSPTGGVVYRPTTTSDSFYRNWVDSGRIFWILGMVVILVLIVFFIKLIVKSA